MNSVRKKLRFVKRLFDGKWGWNIVQGPVYNRLIYKAASELYRYLVAEINTQKNKQILDIGSGPGFFTLLLAQENPTSSVIGIDHSSTQVRAANRLKIRNQIQNCSFRKGNAMGLPFKDSLFDVVVSVASIKHWPDAKRGLQEIRRVLKLDGEAFVGEVDRCAPDEEINWFADNFTAWYVWDWFMRWYLRSIVFGQSYTRKEAEAIALSAGFSYVSVEKVSGWPFFLIKLRK